MMKIKMKRVTGIALATALVMTNTAALSVSAGDIDAGELYIAEDAGLQEDVGFYEEQAPVADVTTDDSLVADPIVNEADDIGIVTEEVAAPVETDVYESGEIDGGSIEPATDESVSIPSDEIVSDVPVEGEVFPEEFVYEEDLGIIEESEKGYAYVAEDAKLYAETGDIEEVGSFEEKSVVYAEKVDDSELLLVDESELLVNEWYHVVFDTEEAKAAEQPLLEGYVLAEDITALTQEELDNLFLDEQTMRKHEEYLLPVAFYVVREVAEDEMAEEEIQESLEAETFTEAVPEVAGAAAPAVIVKQPESTEGEIGAQVSFTVEATGVSGYQWQFSSNGTKWKDSPATGNKTDTLTLEASSTRYLLQYRCALTGEDGVVIYTDAVKILEPFKITTQPVDTEGAIGEMVTFSVEAVGVESYQWKYSKNNGATWKDSPATGNKEAAVTLEASTSRYAMRYCCELTSKDGRVLVTDAVRILPVEAAKIITQPTDFEAAIGENATFTVEAEGVESYQWKFSRNGSTWSDSPATGNKTASITLAASASRYNLYYRCDITGKDGKVISTDTVRIIEPVKFSILTQPTNVAAAIGEDVTFTVEAEGVESYQWKYSKNGTAWSNSPATGNKTESVTLTATEARYKMYYRCDLTGKDGTVISTDVVRIMEPFTIVEQPTDIEAEIGQSITFEVIATGVVTYNWQYSRNGSQWYNSPATGHDTSKLILEVTASRQRMQYRCVLTGNDGNELTTDSVKMVSRFFTVDDVVYEIIDGSTRVRVYAYNGSAATLVIPENPREGYQVVEVGAEAFMDKATLESIDLPDSIEIIGARAFKNCTNLKSMN